MMFWRLLVASLILGMSMIGCGGADDSSPTDSTGSTGGTDVGGSDEGDSMSPDATTSDADVIFPPCPSGMVEKSDEGRCVQASIEADAGTTPPTDAGDNCPDIDGRECTNEGCTFEPMEGEGVLPCTFHCIAPSGAENMGAGQVTAEKLPLLRSICGWEEP